MTTTTLQPYTHAQYVRDMDFCRGLFLWYADRALSAAIYGMESGSALLIDSMYLSTMYAVLESAIVGEVSAEDNSISISVAGKIGDEGIEYFKKVVDNMNHYAVELGVLSDFSRYNKTSYQLAVESGFNGTEKDWNDILNGVALKDNIRTGSIVVASGVGTFLVAFSTPFGDAGQYTVENTITVIQDGYGDIGFVAITQKVATGFTIQLAGDANASATIIYTAVKI